MCHSSTSHNSAWVRSQNAFLQKVLDLTEINSLFPHIQYCRLSTLMPEPSHLLQTLKLEEMPVTRSQGQPSRTPGVFRGRGRGRLNPLSRPSTEAPGSHPEQSHYTVSALDPSGQQRPDRLDAQISVTRMHNISLDDDEYCAIQLNPISVRIYSPNGGLGRVTCSCDTFRTTQAPCAHITVCAAFPIRGVLKLTCRSGCLSD